MSTFKVGDIVRFKKTSEYYRDMYYNPAQVNYVVERLEKPNTLAADTAAKAFSINCLPVIFKSI